jgi:myosin heavy subunit
MDEQAMVPKADDQSCLRKMHHSLGAKAAYSDCRGDDRIFQVVHYAGTVTYMIDGFMSKNWNAPSIAVCSMMHGSGLELANAIYTQLTVRLHPHVISTLAPALLVLDVIGGRQDKLDHSFKDYSP